MRQIGEPLNFTFGHKMKNQYLTISMLLGIVVLPLTSVDAEQKPILGTWLDYLVMSESKLPAIGFGYAAKLISLWGGLFVLAVVIIGLTLWNKGRWECEIVNI
jgi:hypothetical protein